MNAATAEAESIRVCRTRHGVEYRVRPIRADDAERERAFIAALSEESRHNRFMYALREPSPALIERFVNVDHRLTMALVATIGAGESEHIIGVARYAADASGQECEFAVTVADEWQSRGIGATLTRALFEHARRRGFRRVFGSILASNDRMIALAHFLGLETHRVPECPSLLEASRRLDAG
ncbi:MAG: GNAT family N-acetyltransferase [Steroidobacteraceae bacterium]